MSVMLLCLSSWCVVAFSFFVFVTEANSKRKQKQENKKKQQPKNYYLRKKAPITSARRRM